PRLQLLGLRFRHSETFRDERRVLERVALRHSLVVEAAQMESLVRERVRGPGRVELRKAAVASVDACEVDTVEMAQRRARLRREIGMVRGTPGRIEAHLSCFAARVDEAGEEAGTVDADLASREVARDRGEAVLFAHALLVAR